MPLEAKGQIGDSWGVFTSIFSALAFGGLISTLIFQSAAISQAKKESHEQDERYKRQQIENTFFRMLDIHFDLVKEIDLKSVRSLDTIASGKDTFTIFYKRLREYYEHEARRDSDKPNSDRDVLDVGVSGSLVDGEVNSNFVEGRGTSILTPDGYYELNIIGFAYATFWQRYRSDLGHYFRFFFNLVKYVDSADLSVEEKFRYVKIIRAQLTDFEIVIIFYNSLSVMSINTFKPLIEKYSILNNLSDDLIFDVRHKNYFSESAFNN
jgi:hypothetical protein